MSDRKCRPLKKNVKHIIFAIHSILIFISLFYLILFDFRFIFSQPPAAPIRSPSPPIAKFESAQERMNSIKSYVVSFQQFIMALPFS